MGRTFAPTPPYQVSREKIAEFARAVGADPVDDNKTAPPTFPIVLAFPAMNRLLEDPDVGIDLRHIVHGDQRFEQARPVRAGDQLTATLTVESVRAAAGMEMIGTRTEIATLTGERVVTAHATLIHTSPSAAGEA